MRQIMPKSTPFDQLVFRLAILAAIVAVAGCGRETPHSEAKAPITYIDATDGPSGNTTLDTGESFLALNTTPVRSDNLWSVRPYGNVGTVFTSNDIGGTRFEDAPALVTTIRGLAPNDRYEIFAY